MVTVDSRLEDLQSQIHGSSKASPGIQGSSLRQGPTLDGSVGYTEITPVLQSMKMEVPRFDVTDLEG